MTFRRSLSVSGRANTAFAWATIALLRLRPGRSEFFQIDRPDRGDYDRRNRRH
jgi:hypothetical protein